MPISAEWVTAFLTGLGMGCGAVVAVFKFLERRRFAMPIVRWNGGTMTIKNRINEDLVIDEIATDGQIVEDGGIYDDSGNWSAGIIYRGRSIVPGATVPALSEQSFSLRVLRSTKAIVWISSSNSTLRRRRISVHIRKND